MKQVVIYAVVEITCLVSGGKEALTDTEAREMAQESAEKYLEGLSQREGVRRGDFAFPAEVPVLSVDLFVGDPKGAGSTGYAVRDASYPDANQGIPSEYRHYDNQGRTL
jgi:hypothetical protein